MSKLDTNFVKQLYSSKGVELTPEKLQYISDNYASNEELESSFNMKYAEPQEPKTDPEKKNQNSTTTSIKTPSVSPAQPQERKPTSVGEKPKTTGASASSAGKSEDLINRFGIKPGEKISGVEKKAYEAQRNKPKVGTTKTQPVVSTKPVSKTLTKKVEEKYDTLSQIPAVTEKIEKQTKLTPDELLVISKQQDLVINQSYNPAISEEKLKDELDEYQFLDIVSEEIRSNTNKFLLQPLTEVNKYFGGDKDFTIKKGVPLATEKEQAEKELIEEKGFGNFSKEDVSEKAKSIFLKNDEMSQKKNATDAYFSNLPEGHTVQRELEIKLKADYFKSNEEIKKTVLLKQVNDDRILSYNQFLLDIDKKGFATEDDKIKGKELFGLAKKAEEENNFLRKSYKQQSSELETDEDKLELLKYNYNDLDKTREILNNFFKETIGGGLKLIGETREFVFGQTLGRITDLQYEDPFSMAGDYVMDIGKEWKKGKPEFRMMTLDDVNNWSDGGSWLGQVATEQTGVAAALAIGGPIGLEIISAGSGGAKIKQMEESNKNYSQLQKVLSGWAYYGAEKYTEKYSTFKYIEDLKGSLNTISRESRNLAEKSFKKEIRKAFVGTMAQTQIGAGSEALSSLSNSISDIFINGDKLSSSDIAKNMKEAYAAGLVMDGGISSFGALSTFASRQLRAISDNKDIKDVREIIDKVESINKELNTNLLLTDSDKKTLQDKSNALSKKAVEIVAKSVDNVGKLSEKEITELLDINKEQSDLKSKLNELKKSAMSSDLKKDQYNDLNKKFIALEEKRNDIIGGTYEDFNYLPEEEQTKLKVEAAEIIIQEQVDKGIEKDKIQEPNAEVINDKAKELYNQKIQEDAKTKQADGQITSEEKPTTTTEEQAVIATQQESNVGLQEEVDKLRVQEINELTDNVENPQDFITDGKVDAKKVSESDNAKAKEIYAKYDAQIKPLLNNIKTQEDAIQKQITNEGVLQPGQSEVGLQEMGQGDTKQEVVAEQSEEKINNYVSKLESTKASDPDTYWSVSPVTVEDASKSAIIDTEDGATAVKPDGDIVGVFKKPESKAKGVAQELLKKAVEAGGIKLDNFDGYLTKQYEKAGFRVVSKTPFNENYAPEGWNKEKHGTPDVIAMVYDPKGELDIQEKTFTDKDTGYDDMIAYRDALISGQTPKFQKSKIEIDGSTVDLITEEMNAMPEEIAKFDIPSNLTTKEKINVGSLIDRFKGKVKTIKDISELDGVPFIFTISDQLTSGDIKNPFTGNTINVKGGIGFNMTDGNENNAWANTTEAEANNMLQRANEVYSKNKPLFDRLWSEGKLPNGHVPMAVVKMGQTSIKSNEAIFRFASDTFKKKFSKAKRVAAKEGLLRDLKDAKDTSNDVIAFVEKQATIDEVLDNIKELSISKRPEITRFVFTGDVKLGAKTKPGKPKSNAGSALVGDNKDDYKYVHLQTINNIISEPATNSIPDSHIVSIVGIDVLNPSVTKVDHQNYPFGVKGQLIGILEKPVHAADVFPEMYSKSIYLQKENKAGVPTSPETAVRQSVAAGGAIAGIKAFRGAKIASKMTDLQKLLGKLKLAFPSVTVIETKEEFLKELENPNVTKFVKDGDIIYGFTRDGKIFLNPEKANSNTAIHEYSHIWTAFLKDNNPALLKKGYDLLERTSILDSKIKEFGDNELAREEALAELIANKGETLIEAGVKSKFKNWLNAVFNYVKKNFKSFDKLSAEELQDINLNQFVNGALSSLLGGKELTSKEIKDVNVKFSKESQIKELSDAKKEIQEVFSAAKEALKIEKDRNKVINRLKVDANAFIKTSITGLKAGDIGNRAITSIASKIQSITDQNFEEKLLDINTVLDNLYTNKDVNTAKTDSKKAFKNVMSGKVGKLDERGDRDNVMSSKVVNFTKLEPKTIKKVVDEADFEQYKDYISRLADRGLTLSETDLKTIGKLYDRISKPYSDYVAEVNRIQQIIDAGGTLTKGESDFIENNSSDFSERETPETLADKEAKKLDKDAKKEAEIAKKKASIKELLPSIKDVFKSSNATKGSLEWRMLNALIGLSESDVDSMPDNMLTNALNSLNSMVYNDVIPAYAEDLYKYKLKTDYKNALVETVKKSGKAGVYKLKVAKIPLKIREVIGLPLMSLIKGINQKNIDQQVIDRRIKFFNLSAMDAAVKVYGDTPLFNAFMSSFGKAMSRIASTEEKVESVLLRAKRDLDKNSKNPQESYMKIVYHLIDTMAKNNVGTTSSISAMEYFEATVSDPNSKISEDNYMKGLVNGFIDKVKGNGNQIGDLTTEEANAANAIRIVLEENQINAYEANLFQNSNAAPMIVEYYPVLNSVVKQAENDLARLKSKFGIDSVSIKAGNLEDKTGTAHPIDLNPFTSAFSSVRNVLFQHQLRSEYAAITQAINEAIAENSKDNDVLPYLKGIQKALNSQFDLLINGAVHTEPTLTDKILNGTDRAFYTLALGSIISRGVDFAGNMVQLITINPKYISYSNKVSNALINIKEDGESETELIRSFYENAEASDVNKMISSKKINTERTEFINRGINKEVLSKGLPSSNIGLKIKTNITGPIRDTASGAVDTLLGFGDVKPYAISWNGIFYEEFLKQTGEDVNVEKIARGDIEYLKKYKDAISKASNKANQENADLYGSTNPMEKKVGIMEIASKQVKNSVSGAVNALVNKAAYLFSSFDMNARNDINTAINTYIENQEGRNARRFLGGAIRLASYSLAINYIVGGISGLFKGDDDDEEKLKVSFDKLSGDDDFIKEVNNSLLDYPIQKDADGNIIELTREDLVKYNQMRDKLMQNKDFAAAYDVVYGYVNRDLFDNQVKNKIGEINSGKYEYDKSLVEVFLSDMDKGFGKSDDEIIGVLGLLNSQQGYKLFTQDQIDSYTLKIEKYMSDTKFLSNRATRESNKQIDRLIITKTASILSDYRGNKSIGEITTTEGLKLFMGMMFSRSNNFTKAAYNYTAELANKQMIQSKRGERGYDAFKDNVFQTPVKAGLTEKATKQQLTQDVFNILFPALTKMDRYMATDYAIPDLVRFTPLGILGVNDFSKIDSKMRNDVIYQNTNGKYKENIIKDIGEAKIDILRSKEDVEKDSTDNQFRKSRVIPGIKETQLKSRFPSYKEGKDLKVNGNRAN